ncbi:hypothetical protein [Cedecea lapagei]|uniref:hypothetical protein n=1 Tax=Cedecea lapagei TaxID=158823 RepID=UPI001BCD29BF|nr:hypothetical protein [Cedecea lapagei]
MQYSHHVEYDYYHSYYYVDNECINIFDNMVIYFKGSDRIVLNRQTQQFTYENQEDYVEHDLLDITKATDEEIFQYSTIAPIALDLRTLAIIQEEMKFLESTYE